MIVAIVPAAGQSRRMGTPKQLLPYGSTTVIGHIVDQLLASAVDQVCVVVGHEAERITAALRNKPVHLVFNPDYQQGEMLSSIRCGLRLLPSGCEAILIALGDQPSITAELVDQMILAFRTASKGIVVPVYNGQRGHPILLAERYRDDILKHYDDVGLRGVLAAHAEGALGLPVVDPAVLSDMDHPEDYWRLMNQRS
jgi:molybdenum cofactor cytidylyltransferase